MTETDYEKMRREMREMEGRNIAYYRVLLAAYIRTRVGNARMLAALSASGIALSVLVLMLIGVHGAGKVMISCVALLAFLFSLGTSLGILETSAERLLASLKESSGRDLDLEGPSLMAKKSLIIGCVALIVLVILRAWTPAFGAFCPVPKRPAMTTGRAAQSVSNAKMGETMKTPDPGSVESSPTIGLTQDQAQKTTATGSASTSAAAKKSGNAGIFQRGVSW